MNWKIHFYKIGTIYVYARIPVYFFGFCHEKFLSRQFAVIVKLCSTPLCNELIKKENQIA